MFIDSIRNPKTIESTKLMNYLFNRGNTQAMEYGYDDSAFPLNIQPKNCYYKLHQTNNTSINVFNIFKDAFVKHGGINIEVF